MHSITVYELKKWLSANEPVQLIDVREAEEHNEFNIGGMHIPLAIIQNHVEEIKKDIPVVIYCRKGVRSMIAIQKLEQKYPFDNLLNLTGGMEEWKKMVNQ